jgi:hypothetical protein
VILFSLSDYAARAYSLVKNVSISDFQDPYVGAQLWSHGENPYDRTRVRGQWTEDTGLAPINEIKTVYPTTTYFLVCPFTLLGYRGALAIWLAVQFASVCVIAFLVNASKWFGESLLSAFALVSAYSPFHTALHGANPGPLCMALGLAACLMKNEKVAGITLAIAICIKPQIAIWFLLFFLAKKEWVSFLSCVAAGILIVAISLAPYVTRLPMLSAAYHDQYSRGFENGSSGDYTRDKSDRLSMVNLQPAIYQLSKSKTVANGIALLVFCVLGACWFYPARNSEDRLLVLASLVVLSILPIYRRTNDLGLFVLPLVWGIRNARHWAGLTVATCAALFFIPMNSMLARFSIYGVLSGIQSWLVLAMATTSILALWKSRPVSTSDPPARLN